MTKISSGDSSQVGAMFLGEGLGSVGPGAKVVKRSAYRDQECFRATLTPRPHKPQFVPRAGTKFEKF